LRHGAGHEDAAAPQLKTAMADALNIEAANHNATFNTTKAQRVKTLNNLKYFPERYGDLSSPGNAPM
jgi:hypothetical protein